MEIKFKENSFDDMIKLSEQINPYKLYDVVANEQFEFIGITFKKGKVRKLSGNLFNAIKRSAFKDYLKLYDKHEENKKLLEEEKRKQEREQIKQEILQEMELTIQNNNNNLELKTKKELINLYPDLGLEENMTKKDMIDKIKSN